MAYTISNLKEELQAELHGTTLNRIRNIDGLIYRAARQLLEDVDPQETIRISDLTTPIYSKIYDYAAPADLKGNKVVDIFPQVNRNPTDEIQQNYQQTFDLTKGTSAFSNFAIINDSGTKSFRINELQTQEGITIATANDVTGWSVSSDASTPVVDNVNFVSGSGSLKFNLSGIGTTGTLIYALPTSIDISELLNQGTFFLYTYLPTASDFTLVEFFWGTDTSNYYGAQASTTQSGTTFQDGWNLLKFNWLGATVVGTPDPTDITFTGVTWSYDGTAQTAVRLDNITCQMGAIYSVAYYSKYLFRDASTGAWQETVTDDSNIINLDTESYNLLLYLCAFHASQQVEGVNATAMDYNFFGQEYLKALDRYRTMYPSNIQKPQDTYYKINKPYYTKWTGPRPFG